MRPDRECKKELTDVRMRVINNVERLERLGFEVIGKGVQNFEGLYLSREKKGTLLCITAHEPTTELKALPIVLGFME